MAKFPNGIYALEVPINKIPIGNHPPKFWRVKKLNCIKQENQTYGSKNNLLQKHEQLRLYQLHERHRRTFDRQNRHHHRPSHHHHPISSRPSQTETKSCRRKRQQLHRPPKRCRHSS